MKNFFALEPRYSSRKSFYGKAHVIFEDDGSYTLRSYDTDILNIKDEKFKKLTSYWSMTTGRHIVEFAKQHNLPISNKKDFDNLPLNEYVDF